LEITKYISEKEIIEIAKDLIGIEGHKDVVCRESNVAFYIKTLMEKENVSTEIKEICKNRLNVYSKIEGGNDSIYLMLCGHIDTIPGFAMSYEPFKPFITDGKLYGRGSADMKSGIAAMIASILALKRQGRKLNKTIMFAGVIDEEECSKGIEQMVRDQINSEYVVIGEPTSLRVCIAHKGMEWIEIEFTGKATHGSRPKEGKNAVYMAAEFCRLVYEELETKISNKEFELLGSGTINVGHISGGDDPNIVPAICKVQVDRRWLPNETLESIHNEIKEYADRAAQRFGGTCSINRMSDFVASMGNSPHSINDTDEFVQRSLKIYATVLGQELPARDFPAWSDAGILSSHTNAKCIILGPGNINQAHANDEYCDIDEIVKASEIYFQLAQEMCM